MPGLAGVLGTEDARGVLQDILCRLRHRSDYNTSIYWRPGLALAQLERPAPASAGGVTETVELSSARDNSAG